jgi:hypothetical protein
MRFFRRVMIADLSGNFDLELFRYGVRIAARAAKDTVLVIYPAGACMLRSFSSVVHRILAAEDAPAPAYRVLPQPDLDTLLGMAHESAADVILVRYSGSHAQSRKFARRLLREAPCSVWLHPAGESPSFTRAVIGFGLDKTGSILLEAAARLSRSLGMNDLRAVYLWLASTKLHAGDVMHESLSRRQHLAVCRFLDELDLQAVSCTLTVKDAPPTPQTVARLATEQVASLVITAKPGLSRIGFALHRDGVTPYLKAGLPLLSLHVEQGDEDRSRRLWRDLFSLSEPSFN